MNGEDMESRKGDDVMQCILWTGSEDLERVRNEAAAQNQNGYVQAWVQYHKSQYDVQIIVDACDVIKLPEEGKGIYVVLVHRRSDERMASQEDKTNERPQHADCRRVIGEISNLDFWQAYKKLRNGEHIADETMDALGFYLKQVGSGMILMVNKDTGDKVPYEITTKTMNTTTWRIVPKEPCYKVGDKIKPNFDTGELWYEVVYVEPMQENKDDYQYVIRIMNGEKFKSITTTTENWLNDIATKLPS